VEVAKFTAAEKCALNSQQREVHVDSFFDIQRTVHEEFVPAGHTANGKFYCEALKQLREGIRRKRQVEEQLLSPHHSFDNS
jgi:hypothetical protein